MTGGEKMIWAAAFARHLGTSDEGASAREAAARAGRAVLEARRMVKDYADCGGEGPEMIRQMMSDAKE